MAKNIPTIPMEPMIPVLIITKDINTVIIRTGMNTFRFAIRLAPEYASKGFL